MAESPLPTTDIHILSISECFVYKVPPLRSASGHRAEEWSLDAPLFTGALKIYQRDDKLRILIYTYKQPDHQIFDEEHTIYFGECPCEVKPGESITTFVDGVIDSSRYYVLRIKDPKSSRTTLIGIGFRERETAFDFKSALNEYIKYVDRLHLAQKLSASSDNQDEKNEEFHLAPLQHLDEHIAPLKEGEKIKVKINTKKNTNHHEEHSTSSGQSSNSNSNKKLFALKPPPSANHHTVDSSAAPSNERLSFDNSATAGNINSTEEEEWGDFA